MTDEPINDDDGAIRVECDRCGRVYLWRLEDPDTMHCPDCRGEPSATTD